MRHISTYFKELVEGAAYSPVISLRTVLKRAGGSAELKKLSRQDALSKLNKAARDIQNERRPAAQERHKTAPKIDTKAIEDWCKKNIKERTTSALDKNVKVLPTGLTYAQAQAAFPYRASFGDCRGFSYNAKTGEAKWL